MILPAAGERYDHAANMAVQSAGFVLAAGICVIVGLVLAVTTCDVPAAGASIVLDDTINPNIAPAASLARLPGVGPVRARAIVSWRTRLMQRDGEKPVFRCPEDLQAIPGIGPATIRITRPWLSFDD